MKFTSLLFAAACACSLSVHAQTLFTYGNNKAGADEFIRAYNKVTAEGSVTNKEKSIREYLALYINSRLKIQEAYEKGYDTLPAFIDEVNNLRQQVMENYMTDPESYNKLLNEAFARSQKDIRVQHIFIPYKVEDNASDSAVAKLKISEAHMQLSSGKNFDDVALKFSADPAVANNKGAIGFITVFSLPYQFENIIYGLSPGQYSEPYKSKTGYHIFKNISERKAIGKIKAAQILLSFPPGSDQQVTKKYAALADSLYQRLLKGDDFAKLAGAFSNDHVSAAAGGQLSEFSIGTFDPVFENAVISLPANGAVSKPFLTSHGFHIVKRISITVPPAVKNKKALDEIKIQLDKDARISLTRDLLIRRIINRAGFKKAEISLPLLTAYTDSLVSFNQAPANNPLKNKMLLFTIGDFEINIGDLVSYAKTNRWLPDGLGPKPFDQLMEEFKQAKAIDYYKKHMEEYNEDFRQQMNELKEGNLFFDIMMKEVWNKAQTDTAGQLNYYNLHQKKYAWKNSADAVIFYCGDEETAKEIKEAVSKNKTNWKKSLENFGDRSTADSGRFEFAKIPGLKNLAAKQSMITTIEKNKDDNSATFAYIIKVHTQPAQKTFSEAKGDVITDYQEELDKQWINELKKKYPVVVDQKVLLTLIK
jgi:peptidyl-prolyl cis-trans isomerase SurA